MVLNKHGFEIEINGRFLELIHVVENTTYYRMLETHKKEGMKIF